MIQLQPKGIVLPGRPGLRLGLALVACMLWIHHPWAQLVSARIGGLSQIKGRPGELVEITGSGLLQTSGVRFGVMQAAFEIISDQRLRAVIPTGATSGPITIHLERGFVISQEIFQVAPAIIHFEPELGSAGDTILLEGLNLGSIHSLWVGDQPTRFVILADTQVQFQLNDASQSGLIRVESPAGLAVSDTSLKLVGPEPLVTDFEPKQASPGALVSLRGRRLNGVSNIWFAPEVSASFSVVADTQIMVRVPEGATSGLLRLVSGAGEGGSESPFLVLGKGPFVGAMDPLEVGMGERVTLEGVHLDQVRAVFVGDQMLSPEVVSPTQIHLEIPQDLASGQLSLQTDQGVVHTNFELTVRKPGPVLDRLEPQRGFVGTTLIIEGRQLSEVQSVTLGGLLAAFESVADTQLHVQIPDLPPGKVQVVVETLEGRGAATPLFEILPWQPVIESFSPLKGSALTVVTLQGREFQRVNAVQVAGLDATFERVADTQMQVTIPRGATSGTIDLFHSGGVVHSDQPFYLPPMIDAIVPAKARVGEVVTIQGRHFKDLIALRWGDLVIEPTELDNLSVTFVVPAEARSGSLGITTPGGMIYSSASLGLLPWIQSMVPTLGPPGSVVTLSGSGFTEVDAVWLADRSLPFQLLSGDTIRWTVPENASSGPVKVVSAAGEALTPQPFEVSDSADLTLQVEWPEQARWQQPRYHEIRVINHGPSMAKEVVIHHQLPATTMHEEQPPPGVTNERFGNLITSYIPSLAPGQTLILSRQLQTPTYGYENHRIELISSTHDPTLDDRVSEWVQPIMGPIPSLKIQPVGTHSFRLLWSSAIRHVGVKLSQWQLDEAGNWHWVDQGEVQPVMGSSLQWIQVPASHPSALFRLVFEVAPSLLETGSTE